MTNRIDHTNCNHPRTPAGRAACRKASRLVPIITPTPNIAADLRKLNDALAPRTATRRKSTKGGIPAGFVRTDDVPARRQPTARRGKVAASDPRTCVQWELHTGTGRCACGWSA